MAALQHKEQYQLSYMDVLRYCVISKFATFRGRAGRSEFWRFIIAVSIISGLIGVLDLVLNNLFGDDSAVYTVVSRVLMIIELMLLIPKFAAGTRRLHDVGKSGWTQLFLLIPVVGLLPLIAFTVRPGERGENAYGPKPQGIVISEAMARQTGMEATPSRREDIIMAAIGIILFLGTTVPAVMEIVATGLVSGGWI